MPEFQRKYNQRLFWVAEGMFLVSVFVVLTVVPVDTPVWVVILLLAANLISHYSGAVYEASGRREYIAQRRKNRRAIRESLRAMRKDPQWDWRNR